MALCIVRDGAVPRAYVLLEGDDDLRAGALIAHGEHFTARLDLVDVARTSPSGATPCQRTVEIRGAWTANGPSPWSQRRTGGTVGGTGDVGVGAVGLTEGAQSFIERRAASFRGW
jgi:hypothetical protein